MAKAAQELKAPITPFAGRLGGNQEFIVNRYDPDNAALIEQVPDAAPLIPFPQVIDLRGLREPELWKAAVSEGVGAFSHLLYSCTMGTLVPSNTVAYPQDPYSTSS